MYERDEKAVRSSQEDVNDAKDQIAIARLQEQIDLIQKSIDLLEDQREELQKSLAATSKYYEKLIAEQEKYWDSIIEGLENQKSKWEELAEIESIANAYAAIEEVFGELGYSVEDVLGGNEAAFEDFKAKYLQVLSDMNSGNQPFLDGLAYATGQAKDTFGQLADSAAETKDAMSDIAEATAPLSDAANNITAVGTAASGASSGVKELKEATDGIADNLNNMDFSACETFQECIGNAQEKVKELIELISGENGIKGAIEALNNPEMLSAIGTSFTELGKAIESVATALGVGTGGGENSGEGGDNTSSSSASMSEGSDESQGSGGKGLVGAIEEIKNATDTYIGTDSTAEGENAVGSFVALKTAVDNVTTAIGQGGEDDKGGKKDKGGEEGEGGTLNAAITSLQQTTADALVADGDNGVIGMFNTLAAAIERCAAAANELLDAIMGLVGEGLDIGSLHLYTGTANPYYSGTAHPHYEGTAKLRGDWSVRDNEKALVGELGQEIVVDSKTGRFRTVGDNGPEFVNLHRGDIVFNHL